MGRFLCTALVLSLWCGVLSAGTIFEEDFESGTGDWVIEAGTPVWEIGPPDAGIGPGLAYGGDDCAGTSLSGDYPASTGDRLISPSVELPDLTGDDEIHLLFWHWFDYDITQDLVTGEFDQGSIEIRVSTGPDTFSAWSVEPVQRVVRDSSVVWSLRSVDLTAHAGEEIQFAFRHSENADANQSSGWYVDSIEVVVSAPVSVVDGTELDFGEDWGQWSADTGLWQLGQPVPAEFGGPGGCRDEDSQCFGTVLGVDDDGDEDDVPPEYTLTADSRLISPTLILPEVDDGHIWIRFWDWHSYDEGATGEFHVSLFDEDSGEWSLFENLSQPGDEVGPTRQALEGRSLNWGPRVVDLTEFAGSRIRFAFLHAANAETVSTGWYIEDVSLHIRQPVDISDTFLMDFEDGWGDWWARKGVWEFGGATSGPDVGCDHDFHRAATILDGDQPLEIDPTLVSPPLTVVDDSLTLTIWHWYDLAGGGDDTELLSSEFDPTTMRWKAWVIEETFVGDSGGQWEPLAVDLQSFAGKTIRFGFLLNARNEDTTAPGWYLDRLEVTIGDVEFKRGDVDGNGDVFAIVDALHLLEWGFTSGCDIPCLEAADVDDNGVVFPILDAIYLLEYGFVGGVEPPAPGPSECGLDFTDDDLDCFEVRCP